MASDLIISNQPQTLWEKWKSAWTPVISKYFLYFHTRAGITMSHDIARYVKPGDSLLDLGCGVGVVGETLAKQLQLEVTGTDVHDVRVADIPFRTTDGIALPFPDNAFDAVLIAYVLHHTHNTKALLQEVQRVCKGKVFIYEDTPQSSTDRIACYLHGVSYGSLFGVAKKSRFRTKKQWMSFFGDLGFRVMASSKIKLFNPAYVTARTLFVLTIKNKAN